jgi:choline dehydrogenase
MTTHGIDDEYDFVVVGSGAGGGPVAVNLARAGYRVLILEAGGAEEPPEYNVPAFHALSSEHPDLAWNFYVRHYADIRQQRKDEKFLEDFNGVLYPRAGTLGGCTAHHALIFIAPHNSDWNYIAKLTGDKSWKAKSMRKYFERIERCQYLRRPWYRRYNWSRHGYDGWLPTTVADPSLVMRDSVLLRLVMAAIQTCFAGQVWYSQSWRRRQKAFLENFSDPTGLGRVGILHRGLRWATSLLDANDWRRLRDGGEGPVFVPLTVSKGLRVGTRELIRDTEQRLPGNLTVKLNALATRILLKNKHAIGVEFLDQKHVYCADPAAGPGPLPTKRLRTVRARHEVILAGGAFNTPQLLMLSGIGPLDELKKHGIKVQAPLPGVGKNLQDRIEVGVVHKMNANFEILKYADLEITDREFADWRNGHGLYTTNGVVLGIIKRSNLGKHDPDLFLFAIPGHFAGYRPGYSEMGREKNFFTWCILKAHTHNNAGRVLLNSDDPRDPPNINFNFFDKTCDPRHDDLDAVVSGIEFVRKITARTASLFHEIIPGQHVRTRSEIAQFVKDNAWGHHACGTCKIGKNNDPDAVLDGRFRVRTTKNLRVVDASIFPNIPGFFILSAVYMAAEKASDMIIEDTRRRREKPAKGQCITE